MTTAASGIAWTALRVGWATLGLVVGPAAPILWLPAW